jgi:hypothetical protein
VFNGSRQLQRTLIGTNVSTSFIVNDNSVILRLASDAAVSGNVSVQIESTTLTEVPVWRTLVNGKGKCLDLEDRNTAIMAQLCIIGRVMVQIPKNGGKTRKAVFIAKLMPIVV